MLASSLESTTRRRLLGVALASAAAALAPSIAIAQAWPQKPIKLIVPFAPGSATDTVGRMFGQKMSEILGQPIVVDNKAGAVGTIGADFVAKSPADGYTLLVGTNSTNAAVRSISKVVPYDPAADFTPISFLGVLPQVLIVNNDLPAKTMQEFLAYARANPGKLNYSWTSTVTRVATEMLASGSKVQFYNVPYKTGAAAITDVISGQVQFTIVDTIVALPQITGGKVRALAVTSPGRIAQLPNVPTVAESANLPGYELMGIFAAFGPANLPPDVLAKLNAAVVKAGADPDLRARLAATGLDAQTTTSEQLRQRFAQETVKWTKVSQEAKIEAQ
ncbi:MAG: tripartite tricarboxylate transporter substrate binding protein [Bdellovibrionales bacterium]|nr:tripartite tricarboxylate transporter substrate binding protein [Ramlibacter sp.]